MNMWMGAAAALSVLTTAIHIFGGGPAIHAPMLTTDMADDVRATWSVVWHGVSAILAIGSVVLAGATMGKSWGKGGVPLIAAIYMCFTALFVVYGLTRLGNLVTMPQWTVFLVMVVLIGVAVSRDRVGKA